MLTDEQKALRLTMKDLQADLVASQATNRELGNPSMILLRHICKLET